MLAWCTEPPHQICWKKEEEEKRKEKKNHRKRESGSQLTLLERVISSRDCTSGIYSCQVYSDWLVLIWSNQQQSESCHTTQPMTFKRYEQGCLLLCCKGSNLAWNYAHVGVHLCGRKKTVNRFFFSFKRLTLCTLAYSWGKLNSCYRANELIPMPIVLTICEFSEFNYYAMLKYCFKWHTLKSTWFS